MQNLLNLDQTFSKFKRALMKFVYSSRVQNVFFKKGHFLGVFSKRQDDRVTVHSKRVGFPENPSTAPNELTFSFFDVTKLLPTLIFT